MAKLSLTLQIGLSSETELSKWVLICWLCWRLLGRLLSLENVILRRVSSWLVAWSSTSATHHHIIEWILASHAHRWLVGVHAHSHAHGRGATSTHHGLHGLETAHHWLEARATSWCWVGSRLWLGSTAHHHLTEWIKTRQGLRLELVRLRLSGAWLRASRLCC